MTSCLRHQLATYDVNIGGNLRMNIDTCRPVSCAPTVRARLAVPARASARHPGAGSGVGSAGRLCMPRR